MSGLRMLRAALALVAFLAVSSCALAQGSLYDETVFRPTAVIAGASVRVCTTAAAGTPCSPLATIYSDEAMTQPIAGSTVTADARGKFRFYTTEACVQWQISAAGFATLTETVCRGFQRLDGANKATGNYIPTATGQDLGSTSNRWDAFLRNVDISGTVSGGGEIPSGLIMLSLSACPSGYTEVPALSGRFALGTLAAAGDVGGTGGSTSYTPAGSNSAPSFVGNQVNTSAVSAGTPTGTVDLASASVTAETGTLVEAADAVHTHGFTGDALAAHQHTVTATGSVSAPTFTGTPATIQPPFVKVIFYQKD